MTSINFDPESFSTDMGLSGTIEKCKTFVPETIKTSLGVAQTCSDLQTKHNLYKQKDLTTSLSAALLSVVTLRDSVSKSDMKKLTRDDAKFSR